MGKLQRFKHFFFAVMIGLMVTVLVAFYIRQYEAKHTFSDMVEVVVAAKPVPAKTLLTDDMISIKSIPQEYVVKTAISQRRDVLNRVTTVPLAQGEMILSEKLATENAKTALAYHVPKGKRAVTVAVGEIIGVGGFLQAGDFVDVYSTFDKEVTGRDKTILVLENLPVLAVARDMDAGTEPVVKEIKAYTSVTLAVAPDEAARLVFAEDKGKLRLALRPALAEGNRGRLEVNGETISY